MSDPPIDHLDYRRALGRFATGVTVVTALGPDGEPVGITVNSFNSVSLDPPLILWSIDRRASCFAEFAGCERFAVNVLAAGQVELARRFASLLTERFDGVPVEQGNSRLPLIKGCVARFECRTRARHDGGDHLIVVGEVERFDHEGGDELLFFAGQYGTAAALKEG